MSFASQIANLNNNIVLQGFNLNTTFSFHSLVTTFGITSIWFDITMNARRRRKMRQLDILLVEVVGVRDITGYKNLGGTMGWVTT